MMMMITFIPTEEKKHTLPGIIILYVQLQLCVYGQQLCDSRWIQNYIWKRH